MIKIKRFLKNIQENKWMNECKLGPTSPKNEGMKSANGVLIGDGTKTFCTVCFKKKSCLPLSFWEKRSMMPRHKFWVLTYTHTHPENVYIIRQNICAWAASKCVWSSPDTSCSGNWAVREKRCRHYLFFVPSPIKDFILFWRNFAKKWPQKKWQQPPQRIFFFKTKIFARLYFFKSHIASMITHTQTSVTRTNKDVKKCHLAKRRWEWRVHCSMLSVDGCSIAPFWSNQQPSNSPKVFHPKVGGCQGCNLMVKMYN